MKIQEQILDAFSSRGRSLEPLGLQEIAWVKSDALEIVARLADKGVAVLGGDVYKEFPDGLRPTYENWYCERSSEEDFRAFTERSREKAVAFLRSYPDPAEAMFVLVLSEGRTAGL